MTDIIGMLKDELKRVQEAISSLVEYRDVLYNGIMELESLEAEFESYPDPEGEE